VTGVQTCALPIYYDFDEKRSISTGGLFSSGDPSQTDKTSSDGFTPRVLASYDVSEDVTFNAQISQGFRLGGVNDPLNTGLCTAADLETFGGFQSYGDEKLWNYEVGFKSRLGGAFTFNAAAFYADIDDLQVTLDAGSCSSRISFNVPDAHSTGAEFELAGNITDALAVTVAGSIISSEFDSTVIDDTGGILGGVENGNRLASVPEFQISATATYTFPLTIGSMQGDAYLNASFQHIGDRITQPSDQVPGAGNFTSGLPFGGATGDEVTSIDVILNPYTISNLRAGFMMDSWDVAVYVDNLADENANTSFDRERGGRARLGYRTNQPRTVGLTVRKGFGN
jgi:outer membrane receptor protein involved in Fe transport